MSGSTTGYVGSLNEHELGCFNFWSFNQNSQDVWIKLDIYEAG